MSDAPALDEPGRFHLGAWRRPCADVRDDAALRGKPRVFWLSLAAARRLAIMRTHRTRRPIDPAVRARGFVGLVHRIANAVFFFAGFPDDQPITMPLTGRGYPLLAVFDPKTLTIAALFRAK